jgi:hypothetical protein
VIPYLISLHYPWPGSRILVIEVLFLTSGIGL